MRCEMYLLSNPPAVWLIKATDILKKSVKHNNQVSASWC